MTLLAAPACTGTLSGGGADDDGPPPLTVCAGGSARFATLAEAIAGAAPGDVLGLCAGTFAERVTITGLEVTIRGAGAGATIIDGGDAGTAITIGAGADVTIERLTVRHGDPGAIRCQGSALVVRDAELLDSEGGARGGGALLEGCTGELAGTVVAGNAADEGGGLAIVEGAFAVRDSRLERNEGRVRGGAIWLAGDGPIERNHVAGNQAGWTGAGLHAAGHAPVIAGNTIDGNHAIEEGGGIYLHESAAIVTDNTIVDNTALDDGGGVRVFTSRARFERNVIAGNRAGGDGGGMKISHLPSQLADNTIADNVAGGAGGGLELDNDASVVVRGTITGNQAGRGGGVHVAVTPWLGGTLDGVTIAGNRASDGGAINLENNFQAVTLRRLVIDGNRASRGGAIYARGTSFTLVSSRVVNNHASGVGGVFLRATAPWSDPCPCPPVAPAVKLAFVVLRANTADLGSAVWTNTTGATVESSILDGNEGDAVAVDPGGALAWRYNDTTPARFAGMGDPTGTGGNLSVPPMFTDAGAGDLRLRAGSPCVDAGDPAVRDRDGTRADMGLFAGPDAP